MRFPKSVVPLLRFAASEGGRFCIHGAHVVVRGGVTRVEVTDGRVLGVIEYPSPDEPDEDVILNANALTFLLGGDVPPSTYEDDFGDEVLYDPIAHLRLSQVSLKQADDKTVVGFGREVKAASVFVEGKFPPIGDVIPTKEPAASILVQTKYLRKILDAAEAVADTDFPTVWLSMSGAPKGPLVVQVSRPGLNEETFTALLMNVSSDSGRPPLPVYPKKVAEPAADAGKGA